MESLQGHLLVAAPRLLDPNFRRTVVLMLQHTDEGALGLILNRRTKALIKDVWPQMSDKPCESDARLHLGGPVEGPLMAVHQEADLGDEEVLPGLYFTPESTKIEQLVLRDGTTFKLFVGYAGWGAGQLEDELQEGSWLTCPARAEQAFDQVDDLWEEVFRKLGRSSLIAALKIKHVPADPRLN
jgi:putative transcriptional regulator